MPIQDRTMVVADIKLGKDLRALVEKSNKVMELCVEDVGHSKSELKQFLKANRDRFNDKDVTLLLDLLESLDLVEDRLREANEDLSDILFGGDE